MLKTSNMVYKTLVVGVIFLFIGMSFTPSVAVDNVKNASMPISDGNTLYVGGSGEGNYTKIQDAIDNTSEGDTVFVYDDSSPYYENIVVNKTINLIGENKNSTIIDGNNTYTVIKIASNWVNLSNFTIQNGDYFGILVSNYHYSNITNNNIIFAGRYGIIITVSTNNKIIGNNILNNEYGISLVSGNGYNIVKDNNIYNNTIGIFVNQYINNISGNIISHNYDGIIIHNPNNNITRNIIINNDEDGINLGTHHCSIFHNDISYNNCHGIYINYNHHDNIIKENNISLNENGGIYLREGCNNNIIIKNNITSNNDIGIELHNSFSNNITFNNITSSLKCGIYLDTSNSNNISGNKITLNSQEGIYLEESNNNNISNNIITNNNFEGIEIFYYSSDNTVIGNSIKSNNDIGIYIRVSSFNNSIYHNNFINNNWHNAIDYCNNSWDDGYPSGGNYWDDYYGTDHDGDGIGDKPYTIPYGDNLDNYPLMRLWGENLPVANFTYNVEESPVMFDGSSSYDRDGEIVSYEWVFGDGTTGNGEVVYHKYCEVGTYHVVLKVFDDDGFKDTIYKNVDVIIANIPPEVEIFGPNRGRLGIEYEFDFIVKDPDDDEIYIMVCWGDNTSTSWMGPYNPGPINISHKWDIQGVFLIYVNLKDSCGETGWSDPFQIEIPRNRMSINSLFQWFLERFPLLEKLLSLIRIG